MPSLTKVSFKLSAGPGVQNRTHLMGPFRYCAVKIQFFSCYLALMKSILDASLRERRVPRCQWEIYSTFPAPMSIAHLKLWYWSLETIFLDMRMYCVQHFKGVSPKKEVKFLQEKRFPSASWLQCNTHWNTFNLFWKTPSFILSHLVKNLTPLKFDYKHKKA